MQLRRSIAVPGAAAGLVLAAGAAAWPFTVDDAFVLARYARRIAAGLGYTMNDGPPTDGVTGPLALVPALLGELAAGDPVGASKLAGLASMAVAVALIVRRALEGGTARALLTAALATTGSTTSAWAVAGLETGLATLALTVLALAVLPRAATAPRPLRRGVAAGLSVAALAWLRPELALASGFLLVALLRADRRAASVALALALAGASSIVLFRVAMFGTPLPLSAQAKPPDLGHGLEYAARAAWIALGGGGVLALFLSAREGGLAERVATGAVLVHAFAVVIAGGDWMPSFRLFAPVLPLYALAASAPIAARLGMPGRRAAGAALAAACLALPTLDLALQLPLVRAAGETRETRGRELAEWLAANAERVAMVDVGYAAFASGVEVIDLGGITDPAIGGLPGGHLDKRIDPGALRARDPDTIVLHAAAPPRVEDGRLRSLAGYPVERRVAAMAWVRAEMRVVRVLEYAPHYHYVILARPREHRSGPTTRRTASRPGRGACALGSPRPAAFGTLRAWRTVWLPGSWSRRRCCAIRTSSAAWSCSSSTVRRARSASS
ncbi:MAG TPA: hypothetical protein VIL20_03060 [Sandaracinaceae bacterium]